VHHVVRSLTKGGQTEEKRPWMVCFLGFIYGLNIARLILRHVFKYKCITDWTDFSREVCMVIHDNRKICREGHMVKIDES
jgi:hypothetical protein